MIALISFFLLALNTTPAYAASSNSDKDSIVIRTDSTYTGVDAWWMTSEGKVNREAGISIYADGKNPDEYFINIYDITYEIVKSRNKKESGIKLIEGVSYSGIASLDLFESPKDDTVTLNLSDILSLDKMTAVLVKEDGYEYLDWVYAGSASLEIQFSFNGIIDSQSHENYKFSSDLYSYMVNSRSISYYGTASLILDGEDLGTTDSAFMYVSAGHTIEKIPLYWYY